MVATAVDGSLRNQTAPKPARSAIDRLIANLPTIDLESVPNSSVLSDTVIDLEAELNLETNGGRTPGSAARILHRAACRLRRRPEFRSWLTKDLFQELALQLVRRVGKFEHRRGAWEAFVITIAKRRAAQLIKHACARKRDDRSIRSLTRRGSIGGDGASLIENPVTEQSIYAHRQLSRLSDQAGTELRMDIDSVLESCPPRQRELARQLMQFSLTETAKKWNIPRSTLQFELTKLRKRFENKGLSGYFSN